MKKLYPLLSVLFLISNLNGQGWTQTFGGNNSESGRSVQQTIDGGYVITGSLGTTDNGTSDIWLIKTDPNGQEEWNQSYSGLDNYYGDYGHSVQQTIDEGYIITGSISNSGVSDLWLIKTDPNGQEEWTQTFGGDGSDIGHSVQQTVDGGYIIIGRTEGNILLLKTNSTGQEEWTRTFGGDDFDTGWSGQQTLDGGYIILGNKTLGNGLPDIWLIKTDSNGQEEWNQTFGGNNRDYGFSVKQTFDEGYIITGYTLSYGDGINDYIWLIKTDSQGQEEWNQTFGGGGGDYGNSVQQTTDGGYIITGMTYSYGNGNSDVWLIKTDSQGQEEWNQTFGEYGDDYGNSVQQTTDGGYIITGVYDYGIGSGSSDIWLIKTDSTGILSNGNQKVIPKDYILKNPFPNPFNPSTTLEFSIPFSDNVNIRVLDILGREVDVVMNEYLTNGNHRTEWNGQGHPSGIYFISFESGGIVETQKVVLMK